MRAHCTRLRKISTVVYVIDMPREDASRRDGDGAAAGAGGLPEALSPAEVEGRMVEALEVGGGASSTLASLQAPRLQSSMLKRIHGAFKI